MSEKVTIKFKFCYNFDPTYAKPCRGYVFVYLPSEDNDKGRQILTCLNSTRSLCDESLTYYWGSVQKEEVCVQKEKVYRCNISDEFVSESWNDLHDQMIAFRDEAIALLKEVKEQNNLMLMQKYEDWTEKVEI